MGTDVYLEWKDKTEQEEKEQHTGFSIGAGDVGYMRASIGMVRENSVLRILFPMKYWENHSDDEYDFKENYEMLNVIGLKYLVSTVAGKSFEISEEQEELMQRQQKQALAVFGVLKQIGDKLGAVKVYVSEIEEFRYAVEWVNSLFSFFELGIEKQEKGLKPYPYISW